ncbi:MAG: hypothetical protein ACR2J3_11335 [Aridibacter sp.]
MDVEKLKKNTYQTLRIKKLKINGKQGNVELEGNQVFNNFKPEMRKWSLLETNHPTYIYYYKYK